MATNMQVKELALQDVYDQLGQLGCEARDTHGENILLSALIIYVGDTCFALSKHDEPGGIPSVDLFCDMIRERYRIVRAGLDGTRRIDGSTR
jgi:hypothetical protein